MRRSSARLALAAAGFAAAGLALPASAGVAPAKLVVSDPADDALVGGADDIVKLTWTTTGTTTTKRVGRKVVTTYTPKNAVATIETAGAIDTSGTTLYNIYATSDGCGQLLYSVAPGTVLDSTYSYCTDDDSVDGGGITTTVAGSTITFTIPLKSVPGFQVGKKLSGLAAYTGTTDPVAGLLGPAAMAESTPLDNDNVTTDSSFTIA